MNINWTVIFSFFFGSIILIALSMFLFLTIHSLNVWLKKQMWKILRILRKIRYELVLVKKLSKALKKNYNSHSVELIFQSYIHFYEINSKDIDNWALPIDLFPNGVNDLMFLYKWIKKTRPQNYEELKIICQYDYEKGKIDYWGAFYKGFKFKIDAEDGLKIIPLEAIDAVNPDSVFERTLLKLQNVIYDIDTKKCAWILERRKFLGI